MPPPSEPRRPALGAATPFAVLALSAPDFFHQSLPPAQVVAATVEQEDQAARTGRGRTAALTVVLAAVAFPIADRYSSEAADIARDERKRRVSPPSFFFAQSQALLSSAYRGAANKHRNRIRSALFGQLMASFEFCIKDFIAQVIDASDVFDERVNECSWINVDKARVLAQREGSASVGAILVHPLIGWHDTDVLNTRFQSLFDHQLLDKDEARTLQRLWIIRHSVAHNGGFVTHQDAYRLQAPTLKEAAIAMDMEFLGDTAEFLRSIVLKLEDGQPIAEKVIGEWIRKKATGAWPADKVAYTRVRAIVTVVRQRTQDLPKVTKATYSADRKKFAAV